MKRVFILLLLSVFISSCSNINNVDFYEKYSAVEIQNAVNDFKEGDESNILYELKPIKVYTNHANLCLVTKLDKDVEYGYYFIPLISSYYPRNNKTWHFTFFKNGKIEYKKQR